MSIEVKFDAGQLTDISLFHFAPIDVHSGKSMLLVALVLIVSGAFTHAFDFFPANMHRCQAIPANFTLCYGLGYTQMHLPNLLNHESVTEILYELPLWQSLLSLGCHPNARLLLCSILAPVCLQQTPQKAALVSFDNNQDSVLNMAHDNKKFLYPCRTLCESVKKSCEPRMVTQFGYKWPTMSECPAFERTSHAPAVPFSRLRSIPCGNRTVRFPFDFIDNDDDNDDDDDHHCPA